MNEPFPAAAPVDPTLTPYKDRSTGLTVFGSLTILLGCLAFLLILVMMAGMLAAARATNAQSPHPPLPLTAMLPAIMVYGIVGVSLVWLGIGSILARRWARALLFCLVFSVLWAYAAWLLYKMDVRGWWLILIAVLVFMTSSVLTYAQHDMIEMYQRMGYPQSQIDMMRKSGLFAANRMNWFMMFSMVPFFGYLLSVKRYFRRGA